MERIDLSQYDGHTPGPWRWEVNLKSKHISIVGGVPSYDKTVMDFERWGMNDASPRFNEKAMGGRHNFVSRPCEIPNWIKPIAGEEHHADWRADLVHTDARLLAAGPSLLAHIRECYAEMDRLRALIPQWVTYDGTEGTLPEMKRWVILERGPMRVLTYVVSWIFTVDGWPRLTWAYNIQDRESIPRPGDRWCYMPEVPQTQEEEK